MKKPEIGFGTMVAAFILSLLTLASIWAACRVMIPQVSNLGVFTSTKMEAAKVPLAAGPRALPAQQIEPPNE